MSNEEKIERAMNATLEAIRLLQEVTIEYFKDEQNSLFVDTLINEEGECTTCFDDGGPYD